MAWPDLTALDGLWMNIIFTTACIFLLYKIFKCLNSEVKELPLNTNKRQLDINEDALDIFAKDHAGSGNISIALSLTSKQALVHQHVRDALVLLAKRQPMLRAIMTMADGHKYFEIKEMNDVISMLDITTSDVKASDWTDVWCEYTAKQRGSGLLWRLVILKEEFQADTENYMNTLMFGFNHSCTDGVSSVKFCKQFLEKMNGIANGSSSVDEEVSSFDLFPSLHETVIQGRAWNSILNFTLSGLRPVLKPLMYKLFNYLIEKKPNNPYLEQFPANIEVSPSLPPCRLNANIFPEDETKIIKQACKVNNCTVTGAILAAAHLSFCELIQDDKFKNMELDNLFAINARRFSHRKPHEDYIGCMVYMAQEFYMKYQTGCDDSDADFWKLAKETSQRIKDCVCKEKFVIELAVLEGLFSARELTDLYVNDKFAAKSGGNFISSFGAFTFDEQQEDNYKFHECFINSIEDFAITTFSHYIHTINNKMTWQIISTTNVNSKHAEKYANLCFEKLSEMSLSECKDIMPL